MKAAITELSETRRRLDVELPGPDVDAAISRLAKEYRRRAKVPGFRPGKVPIHIVRQRFKDDILRDAARDLVPGPRGTLSILGCNTFRVTQPN